METHPEETIIQGVFQEDKFESWFSAVELLLSWQNNTWLGWSSTIIYYIVHKKVLIRVNLILYTNKPLVNL